MRRNSPLKGSKRLARNISNSPSLERKGLSCDVLAGEQGPSCHSMKHIPDLKVIHVRFIKSSSTPAHLLQLQTLPFEGEETRRYSLSRMNKHPVQKLIHLAWQASQASSYSKSDKLLGITCLAFGETVLCALFGSCRFRRGGVTGSLKHCCLDELDS